MDVRLLSYAGIPVTSFFDESPSGDPYFVGGRRIDLQPFRSGEWEICCGLGVSSPSCAASA